MTASVPPDPVAGLVLAAGAGRRLGRPKATVEVAGERLVDRAVRVLTAAGAHPVHVVLGAAVAEVAGALVVDNRDWADGMGSSLRAGLTSLPADVRAVAILLVDQPGVTAGAVALLLDAAVDDESVAVATYHGRRGHPVVIGRAHWADVAGSARGDAGARDFLRAQGDRVVEVECSDVADDTDVDTPADLSQLRRLGPEPR